MCNAMQRNPIASLLLIFSVTMSFGSATSAVLLAKGCDLLVGHFHTSKVQNLVYAIRKHMKTWHLLLSGRESMRRFSQVR